MGRFAVTMTVATALAAVGTIGEANARTAWANGHRSHHHSHHAHAQISRHGHSHQAVSEHSGITCETVRAYVSQVGLEVARSMARANGMTRAQEHEARQCLAKRD
jgi:hypothetical protein